MALPSDSLYSRGFAADAGTLRALRAGLAGRKVKVQRGRLPLALRTLATEPASRVLFVDLDGVADPEVAAKQVTAVCAVETTVIAIGSVDSAHFTRVLFRHGIADYLVKPISAAQVREASVAATDELPERPYAGRVIAFWGTAGSGTSTLVAAIARSVAADGLSTSVVDLDPISGRLSALLGSDPADGLAALLDAFGTHEPMDSEPTIALDNVDSVCAPVDAGLSLISYSPSSKLPPSPTANAVNLLLRRLANRTHLVLVTGFPEPDLQLELMQLADGRVLSFEPTLSSLSAAVRSLALLDAKSPITVVQCHSRTPRSALSSAHVRYALGDRCPDVKIPFEAALHAVATGEKPKRLTRAYRRSVQNVIERVMENAAVAVRV